MQPDTVKPQDRLDKLVSIVEKAAGIFLGAVAALTFFSIMARGLFNIAIPDWYDISRLMLGIMVFWGIATTSYRGDHIEVDILWQAVKPRWQKAIDVFATVFLLLFMLAFAWQLLGKVDSGYVSGEATFDLRMKIWPFHLVAAFGIFATVFLIFIRLYRLLAPGQKLPEKQQEIG
jgi:TRAP-type C4-dicarboxylate transport system permease small subunit